MDLRHLPLTFLIHLKTSLNTFDLLNFLIAVENGTKKVKESNLYKILFDQKKCMLTNCLDIDVFDLKSILKHYTKPQLTLEEFDVCFCLHLNRHKLTNYIRFSKYKNLKELHALSINLEMDDIVKIVSQLNLRSLSLTLPVVGSETLKSGEYNLESFAKIESMVVQFKIPSFELFAYLMDSLLSLARLEIYFVEARQHKFKFNFQKFQTNKFSRLKELIFGTSNTFLHINDEEECARLVDQLEHFNLNIDIDNSNVLHDGGLIEHKFMSGLLSKIKNVNLILKNYQSNSQFSAQLNEHSLLVIDDYLQELYASNIITQKLNDKLHRIQLNIDRLPCLLESCDSISLASAANLYELDLREIHLHSTHSVCKILADLSCLRHLYLPCCALGADSEYKKMEEAKPSFKRVFEESDEEEDESKEAPKKQLEYLASRNSKLISFGLYCPKLTSKKKEKYFFKIEKNLSCKNVDHAELDKLSEFKELRSLHFENFKVIGDIKSFENILNKISTNTQLKHLEVVNLASFVLFEYQSKFFQYLNNFKSLSRLHIEYNDLFITDKFYESLFELEFLFEINLKLKNFDLNLFKKNVDNFKKLRYLKKLHIECQNKKADVAFFRTTLDKCFTQKISITINTQEEISASNISSFHLMCLSNKSPKFLI